MAEEKKCCNVVCATPHCPTCGTKINEVPPLRSLLKHLMKLRDSAINGKKEKLAAKYAPWVNEIQSRLAADMSRDVLSSARDKEKIKVAEAATGK